MSKYAECFTQGSGQCIPYTDFKTTSAFTWGTSSADPMSGMELSRIPVGYAEAIVMAEPYANERIQLIRETRKKTGQSEIILDQIIERKISYDITESDAILTMIASEEVLGKDWDTPEEDEAWANL
ncbi:MAG: hypothetical protein M0009_05945 [Deltaproteobacteria bacterium]|nr:hypothetical protein [Deltaproteobacteria bacterium]